MQWAHCFVVGIVSGGRVSAYCGGVFGACGGSRGIWGWLWFLWGVAHSGRGLISVFRDSSSIGGAFILAGGGGWVLGYNAMRVRQFPDRFRQFLKSFSNSPGNSYIPRL